MGQAGEFQEAPSHLALEFEPDQEQVSDQGGPDLDQHGILGGAVKGFDLQVLFDPFKKELSGKGLLKLFSPQVAKAVHKFVHGSNV